jgi:hypothetical protein
VFATAPAAAPAAGVLVGLAFARKGSGYRPAVVVTGVMLLLFTAVPLVPLLVGQFDRVAEATATALFVAGAAGLSTVVVALVRRGRRVAAWAAAAVGGPTLAHLASTTLVLISPGPLGGNPWLAYWVMMLPYRGWSTGSERDFVLRVDDALVYYPVLYTFAIAFLLAFCIRATAVRSTMDT